MIPRKERQIFMIDVPNRQEMAVSAVLQLALKYEKPEFRMEFQSCRKVTPEQIELNEEPNILGQKDLRGYGYVYNGRTYRDITTLWVETVEELSKTVYIGKDIHGEKVLISHTIHPSDDLFCRSNDTRVLIYLIFDGKTVHMIVMQGVGSITSLTFYNNLLSADTCFQVYFEKLGWPVDGIAWK